MSETNQLTDEQRVYQALVLVGDAIYEAYQADYDDVDALRLAVLEAVAPDVRAVAAAALSPENVRAWQDRAEWAEDALRRIRDTDVAGDGGKAWEFQAIAAEALRTVPESQRPRGWLVDLIVDGDRRTVRVHDATDDITACRLAVDDYSRTANSVRAVGWQAINDESPLRYALPWDGKTPEAP